MNRFDWLKISSHLKYDRETIENTIYVSIIYSKVELAIRIHSGFFLFLTHLDRISSLNIFSSFHMYLFLAGRGFPEFFSIGGRKISQFVSFFVRLKYSSGWRAPSVRPVARSLACVRSKMSRRKRKKRERERKAFETCQSNPREEPRSVYGSKVFCL